MTTGTLRIGMSTCGLAAGARDAHAALKREIYERKLPLRLQRT